MVYICCHIPFNQVHHALSRRDGCFHGQLIKALNVTQQLHECCVYSYLAEVTVRLLQFLLQLMHLSQHSLWPSLTKVSEPLTIVVDISRPW